MSVCLVAACVANTDLYQEAEASGGFMTSGPWQLCIYERMIMWIWLGHCDWLAHEYAICVDARLGVLTARVNVRYAA